MINLIGVAYGQGAGDPGCADGPRVLADSRYLNDLTLPFRWTHQFQEADSTRNLGAMTTIAKLNWQVAEAISQLASQSQLFVTIGGDQSCSLGTWSGAASATERLGLIWIDAHMDAHTTATTPSGNIHGMPLAALLGYGDSSITQILTPTTKLNPEDIVLIGIRSYEPEEQALLETLGVRIYYMPEVQERGIEAVMNEAQDLVTRYTSAYGVSIDLDGLDPNDTPGVGTPVENGISAQALCEVLATQAGDERLIGAEIVEFNPHQDQEHKTEQWIIRLINAMFKE